MNKFSDQKTTKIKKGTILLRKGEICNCGYKIVSGCLRSYVIDNSGKEHIIHFAPEDWIITDLDSILNQRSTFIFIDAIEDTEFIKLGRETFENHMNTDVKFLKEQNHKLIKNVISLNKRLISLLSSTAEVRYLIFIQTYPSLVGRLPLKLIASYIGITPEYLSEIRRKVVKK